MAEKKRARQLHPQGPARGETVVGRRAVRTVETYGGPVRLCWDPDAAVTAFGQMPYFIEFLKTAGLFEDWVEDCPLDYRSPNAAAKRDVLGTLLLSVLAGRPDKRRGLLIVLGQVVLDGGGELAHATKQTAANPWVGEVAKESLHHLQLRRGGGREIEVKSLVAPQPAFHFGVLVRGVVVHDQTQKPQPLLGGMSGQAGSDHAAVECMERRQERRRAVALVVVRHRLAGLRAIESLDLRFFGAGEDQRVFGRREVESDDIVECCGATGVVAELESVDAMRFAARGAPDAAHGRGADAGRQSKHWLQSRGTRTDLSLGRACLGGAALPTAWQEAEGHRAAVSSAAERVESGPVAAGVSLQLLALGFGQCHSWCCSHLFLLPDEDVADNL